mmetsp:Transcript_20131/g.61236  ORF Transcript_20131/g.61236 Transcript_20131/m.61236 type:complete len:215 (+) Transcript_20131:872-1516(+)
MPPLLRPQMPAPNVKPPPPVVQQPFLDVLYHARRARPAECSLRRDQKLQLTHGHLWLRAEPEARRVEPRERRVAQHRLPSPHAPPPLARSLAHCAPPQLRPSQLLVRGAPAARCSPWLANPQFVTDAGTRAPRGAAAHLAHPAPPTAWRWWLSRLSIRLHVSLSSRPERWPPPQRTRPQPQMRASQPQHGRSPMLLIRSPSLEVAIPLLREHLA